MANSKDHKTWPAIPGKLFWGCFITWPSHLFVHDLHDAVGDGHLGVNRQRVLLRESELEIGDADTKKTIAIAVD